MIKLMNCTPHSVHIYQEGREVLEIKASGTIARCTEKETARGGFEFEGIYIPLVEKEFGQVENLPEEKEDTIYIVSALVMSAAKSAGRTDVAVPSGTVRNEAGVIIGCTGLAQ